MSKWSSMTPLLRPVTKMNFSIPAARASSTTCCRIGRSTTVSISLGTALVAGKNRVPSPATGNTALRMGLRIWKSLFLVPRRHDPGAGREAAREAVVNRSPEVLSRFRRPAGGHGSPIGLNLSKGGVDPQGRAMTR